MQGGNGPATLFGEAPAKRGRPLRKPKPAEHPRFAEWYAAYPLHKDRGDAEKAYADAVAAGAGPDVLLAAAHRYHDDPYVKRGYIKRPARWLHAKCWLDEPAPRPSANGQRSMRGGAAEDLSDEVYGEGRTRI